jgi:hypothetical protein
MAAVAQAVLVVLVVVAQVLQHRVMLSTERQTLAVAAAVLAVVLPVTVVQVL